MDIDKSDLVAQQREARRKRILENSDKRLKKIMGREDDPTPLEDDRPLGPSFDEPLWSESTRKVNGATQKSTIDESPLLKFLKQTNFFDDDDTKTAPSPPKNPLFDKWVLKYHLHAVVLAFVLRLLTVLQIQHVFSENFFLPFLIVELAVFCVDRQISSRSAQTENSFLVPVLVLCGIQKSRASLYVHWLFYVQQLLMDYSSYKLVTFVLSFGQDVGEVLLPSRDIKLEL